MKYIVSFLIILSPIFTCGAHAEELTPSLKFSTNAALYPDKNDVPKLVVEGNYCKREGYNLILPDSVSVATIFNSKGTVLYPKIVGCFRGGDTSWQTKIYDKGEVSSGSLWTNLETNIDGAKDLKFSILGKHRLEGLSISKQDEKSRSQKLISEFTGLPVRPDNYNTVTEEKLWVKASHWLRNYIVYSIYCHGKLGDYGYYKSDCSIPNKQVGTYLYDKKEKTSVKLREGMPLMVEYAFLLNGSVLLYGSVKDCKSCGFHEARLIEEGRVELIFKGEYTGT